MKKKLLFVNNNMHIGGIQKSLSNLLHEIHSDYDITLFLFFKEGELLSDIPSDVTVTGGGFLTRVLGMTLAEARSKGPLTLFYRGVCAFIAKKFGTAHIYRSIARRTRLGGEFDAAVSCMQNSEFHIFYGGCNEFVLESVNAKCKIAFIHCDFANYMGNNPYNNSLYKYFDKIACVSDSCKRNFDSVLPALSCKSFPVYNCHCFDEIRLKAEEYSADRCENKINIFTAARLSREKGILRMLPIFARLKEKKIPFIWRIAGSGKDFDEAKKTCDRLGLSQDIVFLSELKNPYPYFKAADLLLVPSYDEAAPMVFGEAECFSLPVFTTETTSARELVEKRGIGWVSPNNDDDIENLLLSVLSDNNAISDKRYEPNLSNALAKKQFSELIS